MTPDAAVLAAARARFDARAGRRCSLSFDALLAAFQRECVSFTAIGQLSTPPVSRQAVQQLYNAHFRRFCHRRAGRLRQHLCTLKRRGARARDPQAAPPAVAPLLPALERLGLGWRLAPGGSGVLHRRVLLRLPGRPGWLRVGVLVCARPAATGHLRWNVGQCGDRDLPYLLVAVPPAVERLRWWVVPAALRRGRRHLYVPTTDRLRPRRGGRPTATVQLAAHEGAWWALLEDPREAADATPGRVAA